MSNISDDMSVRLEEATEEILSKIDNEANPFEQLKKEKKANKNKEPKKDSHIIAMVNWDTDEEEVSLPSIVYIPDSILVGDYNIDTISDYLSDTYGFCHKGFSLKWPSNYEDFNDFCQWDIEKAHVYGKEEPDFDFRTLYSEGDNIYFVRYYDTLNTKKMMNLKIRKIYPRMLIGTFNNQWSQCIGISERDSIFLNQIDAANYFKSINAENIDEYEESGKKKRKRKNNKDMIDDERYEDSDSSDDNDITAIAYVEDKDED